MRIGLVSAVDPLGDGLHRTLAAGLAETLRAAGHEVETVLIPFSAARDVLLQVWAFRTLPLATAFDRIVTLRPPAHLVVHPRKVAWLSSHPGYAAGLDPAADTLLAAADRTALLAAEAVFTTSEAAAARWHARTGITATILRDPPPTPLPVPAQATTGTDIVLLGHDGAPALIAALRRMPPLSPLRGEGRGEGSCSLPPLPRGEGRGEGASSPQSTRLNIVNTPQTQAWLEALAIRTAGLPPDQVTCLPHASDALLATAGIVACLSPDDDIALPAIDRAAACGRPILVATTCPAAAGRAAAHGLGLAIDPADPAALAAALAILSDPAQAAPLAARTRAAFDGRPTWSDAAWALLNPAPPAR